MTPRQLEIITRLKLEGGLPTPKGIALELINLTQREDCSSNDIARLISTDPALSMRLIKAANALLVRTTRPVVTIPDTVTILGIRAIRQLTLGMSMLADYRNGPCKSFDYEFFWSCSLLTGIAARQLAIRARVVSMEEFFVVGLLAGIGQLAMTSAYPDAYGALIADENAPGTDVLLAKERASFGFDHAEAGASILAELNFPEAFQSVAKDYLQPDASQLPEGSRTWKLMVLLHVAALIAKISLALPSQRGALLDQLRKKAAEVAIQEADIVQAADDCANQWPQWTAIFNMTSRSLPSFRELLQNKDSEATAASIPRAGFLIQNYRMRVLVVDDDRLMCTLLKKMLTDAGHQVSVASNGVEALKMVAAEHPQVIVTDWIMPGMDGIALCRALREKPENRGLYIIVVTAQESQDKLVEAFEAGADDYLIKPITPKIFNARLRAAQRVVKLQEEISTDREQLLKFSNELSQTNERLHLLSLTDALTGLPNRRMALERLAQEWAMANRSNRPLSCMMIDIDHFKSINDTYGHHAGDDALNLVAATLRKAARAQDVVCRYGGEEFVVICPDSGQNEAFAAAERMRTSVANSNLQLQNGQQPIKMTVSIGLSEKTGAGSSVEALLARADANLYVAKSEGRNRTVLDDTGRSLCMI